MRRIVIQGLFCLVALPAVLRACWRLRRLAGRSRSDRSSETGAPGRTLEELATALRGVDRWRLPWLDRPRRMAACVEKLEPILPPFRYGPCLKVSLLLLDLWSRSGLEPTLHLGAKPSAARADAPHDAPAMPSFHAWVETEAGYATARREHEPLWST